MKNTIEKGIIINNKKISGLRVILHQWIDNINTYCEKFHDGKKGDAPYWYNERATLSTLAGAVWQVGGLALEEYQEKKKHGLGRVDLWFQWRNVDYIAEVKQLWFRLDETTFENNLIDRVKERLKHATRDVQKVPKNQSHPLGIVFIVPSLKKNYDKQLIKKFQKKLSDLNSCMLAWCFPEKAGQLIEGEAIYPGVALIAKSTKRKWGHL